MRLLKLRQKELEEKKHMYRCSGCGSRDFCDSDSGLAIVYVHYFCKKEFARTLFCGEGTYGCQFVV